MDKKKKRNIASMSTANTGASSFQATAATGNIGGSISGTKMPKSEKLKSAIVPTMGKARKATELPTAISVPFTKEYKDGKAGKIMKEDPEIQENDKKIKEINKKMKKMSLEKKLKKNK